MLVMTINEAFRQYGLPLGSPQTFTDANDEHLADEGLL